MGLRLVLSAPFWQIWLGRIWFDVARSRLVKLGLGINFFLEKSIKGNEVSIRWWNVRIMHTWCHALSRNENHNLVGGVRMGRSGPAQALVEPPQSLILSGQLESYDCISLINSIVGAIIMMCASILRRNLVGSKSKLPQKVLNRVAVEIIYIPNRLNIEKNNNHVKYYFRL